MRFQAANLSIGGTALAAFAGVRGATVRAPQAKEMPGVKNPSVKGSQVKSAPGAGGPKAQGPMPLRMQASETVSLEALDLEGMWGQTLTPARTKVNLNTRIGVDVNARSQIPYSPQAMREVLEARYPTSKVESTTLPPRGAKGTNLADSRHLKKGVVYDSRGLPDFTPYMKYETQIPFSKYNKWPANSPAHMRYATRQLRGDIQAGKVSGSQFSAVQLKAIKAGKEKIPGHTWEHNTRRGRMMLVKEREHQKTPHIGGAAMNKKIDRFEN